MGTQYWDDKNEFLIHYLHNEYIVQQSYKCECVLEKWIQAEVNHLANQLNSKCDINHFCQ